MQSSGKAALEGGNHLGWIPRLPTSAGLEFCASDRQGQGRLLMGRGTLPKMRLRLAIGEKTTPYV